MNKNFLALAIALMPMAALAEPVVYGHGQVEYASYKGGTQGIGMVDNARGRIGVKSAEDLGNGMFALFKAEFKADFADGEANEGTKVDEASVDADCNGDGDKTDTAACTVNQQTLSKREMMVGLKAGFGTFQLGRLKSPYKYTGGIQYDPYVATVHEARGLVMSGTAGNGGGFGHNGFISDAASYRNKVGPLELWVLHSPDTGGPDGVNDPKGTVAAISYNTSNIHVFVKNVSDDVNGTQEYAATAYGAKLKFDGADLALQIEQTETNNTETDYMFVNLNSTTGTNTFTLNYGTKEEGVNEAKKTTIAVAHRFSKLSSLWVGHSTIETRSGADNFDYSILSMGLRVDI